MLCLAFAVLATVSNAEPVRLRPFDAGSLDSIRRANAGRPFLLAFWSLYCEPCRDEIGQWAGLGRAHPGVVVVLVATDPPQERARIADFLAKQDLRGVETWAFADESDERVRFAVDRGWRGELPRTYIFDASHRAEARSGPLDTRWIERKLALQPRDPGR